MRVEVFSLQDFPGSPVVDSAIPLQGTWVHFLVRELRSHVLYSTAKKKIFNLKKKKKKKKYSAFKRYWKVAVLSTY